MDAGLIKRINRWLVKTEPGAVEERLARLRDLMCACYQYEQARLYETERRVRQVLNEAGVPTITYPFYLGFGREVYARRRRFSGASLYREVAVLKEKWAARGLARELLERVQAQALAVE